MEVYLPMIQSLLSDWYRLTLENQEYATSLALAVWLLTAMFYSIRIFFLKKTIAAVAKARMALQTELEAAQQQQQALQAELAASTEQLAVAQAAAGSEAQRAAGLEDKLVQANRQVIDSIKTLAGQFEVTEPSLPAANDLQTSDLWSGYVSFTAQIAERFKAEQQGKTELQLALWAETAKLAEKEALLGPLQMRLESQTEQVNKLELAVEEQKILRERDQASAEKRLAEALEQHQAELARYATAANPPVVSELKAAQPASQPAQIVSVADSPVTPSAPEVVAEPVIPPVTQVPVEPPKPVEPAPVILVEAPKPVAVAPSAPVPAAKPAAEKAPEKSGGFGKFKQMLNNTMQQVAKFDQKLGTQTEVLAETIQEELEEIAEPVMEAVVELKESAVEIAEAAVEAAKEPTAGVGGKLKNLFGKSKAAEPTVIAHSAPVQTEGVAETATAPEPAKPAGLKGLLKKWK